MTPCRRSNDAYDPDNIFAKIIARRHSRHKVYEDEARLAFLDIMPVVDGHCLVIPKAAARNIFDVEPGRARQPRQGGAHRVAGRLPRLRRRRPHACACTPRPRAARKSSTSISMCSRCAPACRRARARWPTPLCWPSTPRGSGPRSRTRDPHPSPCGRHPPRRPGGIVATSPDPHGQEGFPRPLRIPPRLREGGAERRVGRRDLAQRFPPAASIPSPSCAKLRSVAWVSCVGVRRMLLVSAVQIAIGWAWHTAHRARLHWTLEARGRADRRRRDRHDRRRGDHPVREPRQRRPGADRIPAP